MWRNWLVRKVLRPWNAPESVLRLTYAEFGAAIPAKVQKPCCHQKHLQKFPPVWFPTRIMRKLRSFSKSISKALRRNRLRWKLLHCMADRVMFALLIFRHTRQLKKRTPMFTENVRCRCVRAE